MKHLKPPKSTRPASSVPNSYFAHGTDTERKGDEEDVEAGAENADSEAASPLWPEDDPQPPERADTVHFAPPERPQVRIKTIYTLHLCGLTFRFRGDRPICARLSLAKDVRRGQCKDEDDWERTINSGGTTDSHPPSLWSRLISFHHEQTSHMSLLKRRKYDRNHIIIGRVHSRSGAVKERLADDVHTEQFFHEMRKLMWQLRPWWKQCFSLKSTRAFGLYECFPNHAYHVPIKLDVQTQATLAEFYHDFNHGREETQRRWLPWIQEHFNAGDHSQQPHEARYGLQIIQRWSATKLAVFGSVPILLSFAVGFWFQFSVEGELTAVTQTAWTISGFVIGAAGVGIAILAAVSQYGDD